MTDDKRHGVDGLNQRIYNMMGKKLYEARITLNKSMSEDPIISIINATTSLLNAMDDCYALMSTIFDSIEDADDD